MNPGGTLELGKSIALKVLKSLIKTQCFMPGGAKHRLLFPRQILKGV